MYTNMYNIYKENIPVFPMAVAHLLDVGYRTMEKVTDEEIAKVEGNGLMTAEFAQEVVRVARDIAKESGSVVEIIQFCAAENIFDTEWYTDSGEDELVTAEEIIG